MVYHAQVSAANRRHGTPQLGVDDAIDKASANTCFLLAARQPVAAFLPGAVRACHRGARCPTKNWNIASGRSGLALLGRLAKGLRIPVCVTVHGLDVTYSHPLYRLWLRTFFYDFDAYICISRATRSEAIARGVPEVRTRSSDSVSHRLPREPCHANRIYWFSSAGWYAARVSNGSCARYCRASPRAATRFGSSS